MLGRFKLAVAILFALTTAARSHNWYPSECCHDNDCYHAEDWEVEIREDGYWIVSDEMLIPFGNYRIKEGNIGEGFHLCRTNKSRFNAVKCIFPPGPGF